jgi:hypothetical protein
VTVYEEVGPCGGSDGDASVELLVQGSARSDLEQRMAALQDLLARDGWQGDTRQIGSARAFVLIGDATSSSTLRRVWISTPAADHCLLGIV